MKTKEFPLAIKEIDGADEGTFEGYASVFGVVDSYGERVMPGAFVESIARASREGMPPLMLWQHNPHEVIGVWEDLAEDKKGLYARGRLLRGVARADEAYIMLKAGAIRGLSIGYREVEADQDQGVRLLKKLDLFEVSIVSMPANRRARIDNVKSERLDAFVRRLRAGDPAPIREFEDILRDAGVPRSLATQIASVGYARAIRGEPEGVEANSAREFLNSLLSASR